MLFEHIKYASRGPPTKSSLNNVLTRPCFLALCNIILIKGFLRLEIAIEHELHHHVDRLVPCANTQEFDDIAVVKPGDHGVSHGDVDND